MLDDYISHHSIDSMGLLSSKPGQNYLCFLFSPLMRCCFRQHSALGDGVSLCLEMAEFIEVIKGHIVDRSNMFSNSPIKIKDL